MICKDVQKYFFFLIIATSSCSNKVTFEKPDVSAVDVTVVIDRFDQKLGQLQPKDVLKYTQLWTQEYPYFFSDYTTNILEIGDPKDSLQLEYMLSKIIQTRDFIDLSKAVSRTFPDLKMQERTLTKAFKYIKYYYPSYEVPQLIAYVGGFSYQTPVGEHYVGIGLDMFLGADSEFYPALVEKIPRYISRRFTPENISPRVVETILREDILPAPDAVYNTLQHMIYNGKILYALDFLLEEASDEDKIGYSKKQLDWAKQYQKEIWTWFVQENLLYNTDYPRIQKYFSEAPFTPELGENNESAPKLGSYIGWMIVRKYMERNPQISLKELLEQQDAQQILEDAKFKG